MAQNQLQISEHIFHASAAETATGTGTVIFSTTAAKAVEVWFNITAIAGTSTPTITFTVQTSLDGINYKAAATTAGLTATGITTAVINRADHALGKFIKIGWTISGTNPSFTFDARMGLTE